MPGRRRPQLRLVAAVAVLFAAPAVMAVAGCGKEAPGQATGGEGVPELKVVDADDGTFDYDYVIPFGTADRVDAGEEVEIVPSVLDVVVGERIRIVNDDVQGAKVGIFWVPAGRTVSMEFTTAGTLRGECDVHPDGTFTINVSEA